MNGLALNYFSLCSSKYLAVIDEGHYIVQMSFACSICETTVEFPYQNPIFRKEKPLSHSQLEGIERLLFCNLRIWFELYHIHGQKPMAADLNYMSPQGADLLNTILSINRTSVINSVDICSYKGHLQEQSICGDMQEVLC